MPTLLAPAVRRRQPTTATIVPAGTVFPAGTEELLSQRDGRPVGHPDRARLRDRAIEQNLPMAHRLARRYAGRGEALDDLAQVAAIALINAVDRFDPGLKVPFAGFAIPSILGALKRHFRDTAWAVRVPRPIQELALRLPVAADELSQQRGQTPTTAELAEHLTVSVDEVAAARSAWQSYRLTSLSAPNPVTGAELADGSGAIDPRYDEIDNRLSLQPVVDTLTVREQRIVALRFHEYLNQSQIAAEIGVSQMQVSRLLKQTLTRLRMAMPAA